MSRDANEILSVPFEKFHAAVSRRVEGACGLSADDLPDVDFQAYYPGESAQVGVYRAAIRDCVEAVLESAGYPLSEEGE